MSPRLYADVLGVWQGDGPEAVAKAKRVMAKADVNDEAAASAPPRIEKTGT